MEFLSAFGLCNGPGSWGAGMGSGFWGFLPFSFGGWINILLIGLIVYVTVRLFLRNHATTGPESVEHILKKRYARGEIDRDDYERMKAELR